MYARPYVLIRKTRAGVEEALDELNCDERTKNVHRIVWSLANEVEGRKISFTQRDIFLKSDCAAAYWSDSARWGMRLFIGSNLPEQDAVIQDQDSPKDNTVQDTVLEEPVLPVPIPIPSRHQTPEYDPLTAPPPTTMTIRTPPRPVQNYIDSSVFPSPGAPTTSMTSHHFNFDNFDFGAAGAAFDPYNFNGSGVGFRDATGMNLGMDLSNMISLRDFEGSDLSSLPTPGGVPVFPDGAGTGVHTDTPHPDMADMNIHRQVGSITHTEVTSRGINNDLGEMRDPTNCSRTQTAPPSSVYSVRNDETGTSTPPLDPALHVIPVAPTLLDWVLRPHPPLHESPPTTARSVILKVMMIVDGEAAKEWTTPSEFTSIDPPKGAPKAVSDMVDVIPDHYIEEFSDGKLVAAHFTIPKLAEYVLRVYRKKYPKMFPLYPDPRETSGKHIPHMPKSGIKLTCRLC